MTQNYLNNTKVYDSIPDGARIHCSSPGCTQVHRIRLTKPLPLLVIAKKMRQAGWDVDDKGKKAMCPTCRRRGKLTVVETGVPAGVEVFDGPKAVTPRRVVDVRGLPAEVQAACELTWEALKDGPRDVPEVRDLVQGTGRSGETLWRVARAILGVHYCNMGPGASPKVALPEHADRLPNAARPPTIPESALGVDPARFHPLAKPAGSRAKPSKPAPAPVAAPTVKAPEEGAQAPTAPTRDALRKQRELFALLDEHFRPDERAYVDGWSDDRVAKEVQLSVEYVRKVRDEVYGPCEDPEAARTRRAIAGLERAIEDVRAMAKRRLEMASREIAADVEKQLAEIQGKLDAMKVKRKL